MDFKGEFSLYQGGSGVSGDFAGFSETPNPDETFSEEHHLNQLSEIMVSKLGLTSIKSNNNPIPASNYRDLFVSLSRNSEKFAMSALKSKVDNIPTEDYVKMRGVNRDASVFLKEVYDRALAHAMKLPERGGEYTPSAMKSIIKSKLRTTIDKDLSTVPLHQRIGVSLGSDITRRDVLVACGVCEIEKKRKKNESRRAESTGETEFDEWRSMSSADILPPSEVVIQERASLVSQEARLSSSFEQMNLGSKKVVMGNEKAALGAPSKSNDLSAFREMFAFVDISGDVPLFERTREPERIISEMPRESPLAGSVNPEGAEFGSIITKVKGGIKKIKDKKKRRDAEKKREKRREEKEKEKEEEEEEEEEEKRKKKRTMRSPFTHPSLRLISSVRSTEEVSTHGKHIAGLGPKTAGLFASLSNDESLFKGVSISDATVPLECHDEKHMPRDASMPPLVNISAASQPAHVVSSPSTRMERNPPDLGPNQTEFLSQLSGLFSKGFQSGTTDVFLPSESSLQWLVGVGIKQNKPVKYEMFWNSHCGQFNSAQSSVLFKNNSSAKIALSESNDLCINHEHSSRPNRVSSKVPMKLGDRQVDVWIHDTCLPNRSNKQ